MRAFLRYVIYKFLLIVILFSSLMAFLLTTTPGIYVSIKLISLLVPGQLTITKGTGDLNRHWGFEVLEYTNKKLVVKLTKGNLDWHLNTLLQGRLDAVFTADHLLVYIKDPTQFHFPSLKLPFQLHITQAAIHDIKIQRVTKVVYFHETTLTGDLAHQKWTINELKTIIGKQNASLTAKGQAYAPYPLEAKLLVESGRKLDLRIHGDIARYQWEGRFKGSISGDLKGQLKNGHDIDTELNWYDASWPLNKLANLKSKKGQIRLKGTWSDWIVSAHTQLDAPLKALWDIKAHANAKQTDVTSVFQVTDPLLKTSVMFTGNFNDDQHGRFKFALKPGVYQLPEGADIPFKGGDVNLILSPKALEAKGSLAIDTQKIVTLAARIPNFRLNNLSPAAYSMEGSLGLRLSSLDFLEAFSQSIANPQGQLLMTLTATGPLTKPRLKGDLSLQNASLSIPKAGLVLNPIQAKLETTNNRWNLVGSAISQGQSLTLKGQGDFSAKRNGQLILEGAHFPIMKTPDYAIEVSPSLLFSITPTSTNITGTLLIPSAQLKPVSFSNTVSLSEDVVFVSKKPQKSANPFAINTDILIKMGDDVAFDVKGLHGFLDGEFRIQKTMHSAMQANGELLIRDGKYQAYGQNLVIDQGQISFSDGTLDNPALHIRAIRKINSDDSDSDASNELLDFSASNIENLDTGRQAIVGIEMDGRLNAHKIKLFSIPSNLSQADILSLLLLGKPANQASKSGGQLLLTALSSMNLDSGSKGLKLLTQLKQSTGVDINVNNNNRIRSVNSTSGDNTSVVLGKSLFKRIYVSYNIGLMQNDTNVLTLKYLLNKFFSIQVTTSTAGNGLDFLYTHKKK
jgi:translocation and assembly module TamB